MVSGPFQSATAEQVDPSAEKGRPIRDSIEIANLTLRPDEQDVLVGSLRAGLTGREFELFTVLVETPDRVLQRGEVYTRIWGGTMPKRDRAVDVLVRKVRIKLETVAPGWSYIHTHFGVGYRFQPVGPSISSSNGQVSRTQS